MSPPSEIHSLRAQLSKTPPRRKARSFRLRARLLVISLVLVGAFFWLRGGGEDDPSIRAPRNEIEIEASTFSAPLVMQGGDPYIRALMRTISASEANTARPYTVLYGGTHVRDLSHHPDRCVPIVAGPNIGNCTTAAGRYQFLTTTWIEKADRYHPGPSRFLFWKAYSFEAKYQDQVVYQWLSDPQAWGMDLAERLRMGELTTVLQHLSGTWTSLGYGIEPNVMTDRLPSIYEELLSEELQLAESSKTIHSVAE